MSKSSNTFIKLTSQKEDVGCKSCISVVDRGRRKGKEEAGGCKDLSVHRDRASPPPRWHQWQRTRLLVQEMEEVYVWSLGREIPWRRKWHPTPVFVPGESHGQTSLVGYNPWGHKHSDTTRYKVTVLFDVKIRKA